MRVKLTVGEERDAACIGVGQAIDSRYCGKWELEPNLRSNIFIGYWNAVRGLNINSNWAYSVINYDLNVMK